MLCLGVVVTLTSTSLALTIDDFSVGELYLVTGPGFVDGSPGSDQVDLRQIQQALPSSNVIAGMRHTFLGTVYWRDETDGIAAIAVSPADGGLLSVHTDLEVEAFRLRYGFPTDPAVEGELDFNLDLSAEGTRAVVDFVSADVPAELSPTMELTIWTHDEALTNRLGSSVEIPFASSQHAFAVDIALTRLVGQASLTDVDGLWLTFNGIGPGTEFTMNSIRIVPEPTSVALCGIAACGLLGRRWAQKRRRSGR
jgi:hypothetical protein